MADQRWLDIRDMGPIPFELREPDHDRVPEQGVVPPKVFVPPDERPIEVNGVREPGGGFVIRFRYLDDEPLCLSSQLSGRFGTVEMELGKDSKRILALAFPAHKDPAQMRKDIFDAAQSVESSPLLNQFGFASPNRTAVKTVLTQYVDQLVSKME